MLMYTILTTASMAAILYSEHDEADMSGATPTPSWRGAGIAPAPTAVANPIGGLTTPVTRSTCQRVDQRCTGFSQDQANAQCCSDYCHVMSVDRETGRFFGLCETSCKLVGAACSGASQLRADAECCSGSCNVLSVDGRGNHYGQCVSASAAEKTVKDVNSVEDSTNSCKLENDSCAGASQLQADAKCCSGSCDVLSVDAHGTHYGHCQKPACQPLGETCEGRSFGEADSQCCSGNCNHLVLKGGVYHGHCEPESASERSVLDVQPVEEVTAECQRTDQRCTGFSQDQANAQCCSDYCHVMSVDGKTGRFHGLCEDSCKLENDSCSGASKLQADAKCCSGSCDVQSVDGHGTHYGHCQKSTCQPLAATCQGRSFGEADAQCCSGNCNNFVKDKDGVYHGYCFSEKVVKQAVVEKSVVAAYEASTDDEESCKRNDKKCRGYSQGEADSKCCSGYCNVLEVDEETGKFRGFCEESCKLENDQCYGKSQLKADAKCCSGSCDVKSVDDKGTHYGICAKDPPTCDLDGGSCTGASKLQADAKCCSGRCDVFLVDAHGTHEGICKPSTCNLNGDSCSGASKLQADAKCCSGSCDVMSVDDKGTFHGVCYNSTCQPQGKPCSGEYLYEADAQCCSGGRCRILAFVKGKFHGECGQSWSGFFAQPTSDAEKSPGQA